MNSLAGLIAVALLLPFVAQSQHEADNWYFGDQAAISFAGGSPVALTNSKMSIQEGVTSVSDPNGQLLFYCDGMSVWNRQHQVMPNGMDLHGNESAAQAALAVPFPGHPGQYFLFTVGGVGNANGLQFSIIDMALNGGLGDITQKNTPLIAPTTEKLSAAKHCNGKDYWIITHKAAGAGTEFFAYLLTNNGVTTAPVTSNIDGVSTTGGQLKISPNNKKMAVANPFQSISTVLFDFDNQSGAVFNPVTLLQLRASDIVYGVEFSPNSTFLYTTLQNTSQPSQRGILKYNVTLSTANDIIASRDTVFIETLTSVGNADLFGSMQLGPDKKIYISPLFSQYLAIIPNPDLPGKAAGFILKGVFLGGQLARLGLPNFPASFIQAPPLSGKRVDTVICINQSIVLQADPTATSFLWQDGTTAVSIRVTAPGLYWVQETSANGCLFVDSFHVGQKQPPIVTLGMDTVICPEQRMVLEPVLLNNQPVETYRWQDGSTQPQFTVVSAGTYHLQAANSCGATNDTLVIANGVCRLLVPTAFTPNGDGRNEQFRAFFGENVATYSLQVYNRWGQLVFTSHAKNEGWNGALQGHAQPAGTYTWAIRYKVLNNMREMYLKGNVLLIR
jgi:gliding motility-associated-like protein